MDYYDTRYSHYEFKTLDLNLLLVFEALMDERNVTRAGQPKEGSIMRLPEQVGRNERLRQAPVAEGSLLLKHPKLKFIWAQEYMQIMSISPAEMRLSVMEVFSTARRLSGHLLFLRALRRVIMKCISLVSRFPCFRFQNSPVTQDVGASRLLQNCICKNNSHITCQNLPAIPAFCLTQQINKFFLHQS